MIRLDVSKQKYNLMNYLLNIKKTYYKYLLKTRYQFYFNEILKFKDNLLVLSF